MSKAKVKKNDEVKVRVEEISAGILEENNAFILGIIIPGRGKIKIKVTFEKESPYL